MATTTVFSSWTGTRGVANECLPEDWEEARIQLEEHHQKPNSHTEYNATLVARAWEWLIREFGNDAEHEELSFKFVVELYLDS